MASRVEIDESAVNFVPRYPFVSGTSYSVILDPCRGGRIVLSLTRDPEATGPLGRVTEIYPTATQIPRNHLRFYVYFSERMSEGWATHAVSVRRLDTGEVLEGAILPMDPELWDPERRRLTVLLDPGRIKRGLLPNTQAGYPLAEGMSVGLEIDATWPDAKGHPLQSSAERVYAVGPDERRRVDPWAWPVFGPVAGSRAPLTVAFDRPLDHALLQHCLRISDRSGARVAGRSTVAQGEQHWSFAPAAPWEPGRHTVTVDARLEDLAGNAVARVFDRDLTHPEDDPLDAAAVSLEFDCQPAGERPR